MFIPERRADIVVLRAMKNGLFLLLLLPLVNSISRIVFIPSSTTLIPNESFNVSLTADPPFTFPVTLYFSKQSTSFSTNSSVDLPSKSSSSLFITALQPISEVFLEVSCCTTKENGTCDLDLSSSFFRLSIIRSRTLDVIVVVVGWLYFVAWSISFYPQIILNFQRKSVAGLNFDFVLLNTIGFASYTLYNSLIYWDGAVQSAYKAAYPRSPLPVLLNDVVFAAHALAACIVTALQAIFMEKQEQKVSNICIAWSIVLVLFGGGAGILCVGGLIRLLLFVDCLSYIKMAITLSKYFPQAIFNWRRKSTAGWSIGNILLDLTGGTLDLVQIGLQGFNVANFSAIIGNPVKFGLGFVSIVFDIFFMFQHYVLYRNVEVVHAEYENIDEESGGIDNEGGPSSEERREIHDEDTRSTAPLE